MTDIVGVLQWLAQQGITALVKADGERMQASSATPWTFVASGGPLSDGAVHFDATSVERIIQLAVPLLSQRGVVVPDELLYARNEKVVMSGILRWIPAEAGGRSRPFGGGQYVPTAFVEPGTIDDIWSIAFEYVPPGNSDCEARASWLAWENGAPAVIVGDRLTVTEGPRPVASFEVRAVERA